MSETNGHINGNSPNGGSNGASPNGGSKGNSRFDVTVEDNPYFIRRGQEIVASPDPNPFTRVTTVDSFDDKGDGPAVETKAVSKNKRLILVLVPLVMLAIVGLFAYVQFGGTTKIEHQIKVKPGLSGELGRNGAGKSAADSTDPQTLEAIKQSQDARRSAGGPIPNEFNPAAGTAPQTQNSLPIPEAFSRQQLGSGNGEMLSKYFPPLEPPTPKAGNPNVPQNPGHIGPPSIYNLDPVTPSAKRPVSSPEEKAAPFPIARVEKQIALPTYGEMLPVKTLGGVYTMRNSPARLELTRDMKGKGWELRKGTVFIAESQGSLLDRAYLNVIGFIDPDTNTFVKLKGDTLGGDGTPGIKGKRRQISSRWSKFLQMAITSGTALGQSALSSGGSTVTIGASGFNPNDFALVNSINNREFVEVQAGAPAYILVTNMPEGKSKGVDANPQSNSDHIEKNGKDVYLTDVELSDLLTTGDPEKIKEAIPRMTPEMRRIAQMMFKGN